MIIGGKIVILVLTPEMFATAAQTLHYTYSLTFGVRIEMFSGTTSIIQ